ncbi:MAG TPA: hypothetical protein VL945_02635 [Candidatus Saccharimonadales bacterium]|nr:hypothetical protein [Candidatus Saccharimonadales bacterium]
MGYSIDKYRILCLLLLFLLSSYMIIRAYDSRGTGWDLLSRYLDGRTLASSYFYSHLGLFSRKVPVESYFLGLDWKSDVTPGLTVSDGFYFDDGWEPLPSVLIALFIVILGGFALQAYLVFLVAFLIACSCLAARKLDVDPLLLASIIIGPYAIGFTILYNGGEALAMGFGLLALAYAAGRDYKAGALAGLVGLAKYGGLIVSPVLFLLGSRKVVLKALLLELLVTLPWLLFNFLLFGNPLQGYAIQIAEIQPQHAGMFSFFSTLGAVLWYPLALVAIGALAIAYLGGKKAQKRGLVGWWPALWRNRRMRMIAVFLLLSVLGFLFVFRNAQGPIRLAYLVYLGVAVIAAVGLSVDGLGRLRMKVGGRYYRLGRLIPYLVFITTLVLLVAMYANWMWIGSSPLGSLGFKSPEYASAVAALQAHNLTGCRIVSNGWPYMNLYNVTAYAPYQCNSTIERLPIVIFNNTGVTDYCSGSLGNLTNVSERFDYPNFSIVMPDNYTCVR